MRRVVLLGRVLLCLLRLHPQSQVWSSVSNNVMVFTMSLIKRRYVFDVVRAVVPKIDLDNVFIAKEEIAQDVQATLTKVRCDGAFLQVFVAALCGYVMSSGICPTLHHSQSISLFWNRR